MKANKNYSKKTIFFLKNRLFRKYAFREYKRSLENAKLSDQELNHLNFQKRVRLLKFVYDNIPFYKNFYNSHNINPKYFSELDYWGEIPILKKEHIRENSDRIRNPVYKDSDLINVTTGGSTGEPLKLYRDKKFPEEIIKWRMLNRWGLHPGEDVAMFWRIPHSKAKIYNKILNKIIWWPTRRISIDASSLSYQKMLDTTKQINKYKPGLFWGYVGAIEEYAIFLEENNIELDYKPECVWVTAAPVSEVQMDLFREKFTGNIINQYACSEIHWVASSVPDSNNLLIDYDYRHVDIVNKKDKPTEKNEYGDILLTDLQNYAFPLIKYQVGDRSKFINERSSLAPAFPMMAPVKGRVSDNIETKNGIVLSGEFLTTIFDEYTEEIRQFQIRKIDAENVELHVVPKIEKHNLENIFERVKEELQSKSNNELNFGFRLVDEIKSDRGKTRFIIDECKV